MKHKALSIILTLGLTVAMATLSGCGSSSTDSSSASETSNSGDSTDSGKSGKVSNVKMSDDFSDYTFTLDGVVYQLPFDFSELTENGWTVSEDSGLQADDTITSGDFTSIILTKDGNEIYANTENNTSEDITVLKATVTSLEVDADYVLDTEILQLAKGITLSTSKEDAAKAMEAEWVADDEQGEVLLFIDDSTEYYGEIECGCSNGTDIDMLLICKENSIILDEE